MIAAITRAETVFAMSTFVPRRFAVRVIRNSSVLSLQGYFTHCATQMPVAVNWQTTELEVVRSLLQAFDKMSDLDIARIVNDLERVDKMADEGGQTAIYNVVEDHSELEGQRSAYDRAMWLFRTSPIRFRHAEEVRFTDEHRHTRIYDGFVGRPNVVIKGLAGRFQSDSLAGADNQYTDGRPVISDSMSQISNNLGIDAEMLS